MKILVLYLSVILTLVTGGIDVFGLNSHGPSFLIVNKVSYNGGMKIVEVTLEVRPGKSTITRETYLRSGDTRETASMVLTQKEISYNEIKKLYAFLVFADAPPQEKNPSDSHIKREIESDYAFFINGKQQYPSPSTVKSDNYRRLLELFHKYEDF